MTTAIATEVQRRRRQAPLTLRDDFVAAASRRWDALRRPEWPIARYQTDPVGFARDAFGYRPVRTLGELVAIRDEEDRRGIPWDRRAEVLWWRQIEILEAVRDNARVAVSSGHKIGKSLSAVLVALWFFCSFPDARVIFSSTTSRQVDTILWRELRMRYARSRLVLNAEPPLELAKSGLKAPDFREVVGFTAREAEAVAGVSGKNLLYIVDEASGVDDAIFQAIDGNRAGGARLLLFSNPTRTDGEFYEAFHGKKRFYRTIPVSSEETPNARSGRVLIPGLAERAWIEEKREEYGEDSAYFAVRVLGKFPVNETGKIIGVHAITVAQQRWHDTPADGRLHIGVDPAGEQGNRDESAFAIRRGNKCLKVYPRRRLSDVAHADEVIQILRDHRRPGETPVVAVDVEGTIGIDVADQLSQVEGLHSFELVRVKVSAELRRGGKYDRLRDAVWGSLERWIKGGGAIPTDDKLEKELNLPRWEEIGDGSKKLLKATSKKELRSILGRSPDRADALALSVWEPSWLANDDDVRSATTEGAGHSDELFDPYEPVPDAHADRVFDPYRGGR